tara:strand:- start:265 stop:450 length:186 start_codon:yes stop_codon:yes gene_type:complete
MTDAGPANRDEPTIFPIIDRVTSKHQGYMIDIPGRDTPVLVANGDKLDIFLNGWYTAKEVT